MSTGGVSGFREFWFCQKVPRQRAIVGVKGLASNFDAPQVSTSHLPGRPHLHACGLRPALDGPRVPTSGVGVRQSRPSHKELTDADQKTLHGFGTALGHPN